MYATDREIRDFLPEMDVKTRFEDVSFDAASQIQPCSIDLRLDAVFWRPFRAPSLWVPWRRRTLDLRRERLLEISPRRHWRRTELRAAESIVIKPGTVLLGRVYEEFTMPATCAGKLEGRSSYARMGLSIHCTGDFINPGWRGHMPLELVNSGRSSIRLFPYLPICQVMLVRLSGEPERTYGHADLSSKYIPDDGGPSYWWRDKVVKQLLDNLGHTDLARGVQAQILDLIGEPDYPILERLEHYVDKQKVGNISSIDSLVDEFAKSEDRARKIGSVARAASRGAFPMFLAVFFATLMTNKHWHWGNGLALFATIITIPISVYGWGWWDVGPYLGVGDLRTRRQQQSSITAPLRSP